MAGQGPGDALPDGVGGVAGAVLVADESVEAGRAEPVLAVWAFEASIAQAGSVDVVTLGTVLAVTVKGTLGPVGAHRAFLLAPGQKRYSEREREIDRERQGERER